MLKPTYYSSKTIVINCKDDDLITNPSGYVEFCQRYNFYRFNIYEKVRKPTILETRLTR